MVLGEMHFYGGKIFLLIVCLKQFFLGTTKFLRALLPNFPRGYGPANTSMDILYVAVPQPADTFEVGTK